MFDKQYKFRGKHAYRVGILTGLLDEISKVKIFDRNIDVYTNAPLIGFLYGRTADVEDMKNPDTGLQYNENIMGDRVIYSSEELMFNFRLIMLLDKEYEPDVAKRIDNAFRNAGKNPNDEERFNAYVRGGVDVLYEKIINDAENVEDYVNKLYDFLEDFQEHFNADIDENELLKLCSNEKK